MFSRLPIAAAAVLAASSLAGTAQAATVVVDGTVNTRSISYISFSHSGGAISFAATPTQVPSSLNADLMVRLFANNGSPFGALTGADLGANDDGGPAFDPLLSFANLVNGAYILAVGTYDMTTAEGRSGIASTPISPLAYRATITSDRAVTLAGAVPEPATWAMMLVGFGGMGFAMRRRKGKVTTTVAYA